MNFKKTSRFVLPIVLSLGSIFVSNCIVGDAYASRQQQEKKTTLSESSMERTKELWGRFKTLVKKGSNESEMEEFFKEVFNDAAISKRFCGKESAKVTKAVVKFLLWRLKSQAIQSVNGYDLQEEMSATEKPKTLYLKTMLNKKNENPIELTVVYSKKGKELGKAVEVIVVGIPLIEGFYSVIKKYLEKQGKSLSSFKTVEEREDVVVKAADDFIASNSNADGAKESENSPAEVNKAKLKNKKNTQREL